MARKREYSQYFDDPIETTMEEAAWYCLRHGAVKEVVEGTKVRFKVQIWDEGREPFITQWFNDPRPAKDFLESVINENERHHDIRR